jgi:hypothetical protein
MQNQLTFWADHPDMHGAVWAVDSSGKAYRVNRDDLAIPFGGGEALTNVRVMGGGAR